MTSFPSANFRATTTVPAHISMWPNIITLYQCACSGVETAVPPGSAECAGATMNLLCALKLNYANTTNT